MSDVTNSSPQIRPPGVAGQRSTGDLVPETVLHDMSELARALQAESTHSDLVQTIVEAAVTNIPGADYAGVTLVSRRGEVTTPATTDPLVVEVNRLQYETGQGPCLTSAREHLTVRSDDLATDNRWPKFAPRAAEAGVGSMLCLQLFVQDDTLGALNLYSRALSAFDEESEDIGLVFAAHAALAMVGSLMDSNLRIALSGRDMIGQAKGILMERYKVGELEAFRLLIRASQTNNVKISVIANMVATTGQDLTAEAIKDL